MCSAYETPHLPTTADDHYEMPRLSSGYESVRSTATSNGIGMYASIREPSTPAAVHENSPADARATDAADAATGNRNTNPSYQTPQFPPSATTSNGTQRYTRLQQSAMPEIHENNPDDAVAATDADATRAAGDDGDGYETPRLPSAYETPQLYAPTTASNAAEMYANVQRPAMSGVRENMPAAATVASDAAAAGVNNDGYEIPIPTEVPPSPPHAYIDILPDNE